jgi:hypothetical protein
MSSRQPTVPLRIERLRISLRWSMRSLELPLVDCRRRAQKLASSYVAALALEKRVVAANIPISWATLANTLFCGLFPSRNSSPRLWRLDASELGGVVRQSGNLRQSANQPLRHLSLSAHRRASSCSQTEANGVRLRFVGSAQPHPQVSPCATASVLKPDPASL